MSPRYPFNIRSKGQRSTQGHRVTKYKNIFKAIEWPAWLHSIEWIASSFNMPRYACSLLHRVNIWTCVHSGHFLPTIKILLPTKPAKFLSEVYNRLGYNRFICNAGPAGSIRCSSRLSRLIYKSAGLTKRSSAFAAFRWDRKKRLLTF